MAFVADASERLRHSLNASTSGADVQANWNASAGRHGNMTAEQMAEEEASVKNAVRSLSILGFPLSHHPRCPPHPTGWVSLPGSTTRRDTSTVAAGTWQVLIFYAVLVVMLGAQTGLFWWKRKHKRSYELVTLLGLWLVRS